MNILSFDIEEWYVDKTVYGERPFKYKQFDDMLAKVLNELDRYDIKATFFCVGKMATEFPEVIRKIVEKGHEIGCHSNEHTWIDKMSEEELLRDTMEALKALEDLYGKKVESYRAPAFSITENNKWAVNVLSECGIKNDASIFPTSRDFGGYNDFPIDTPCVISHNGAVLKEYPICLTSVLGKTMAFSGGGYFRLLPYWLVSKKLRKRDYNICYFHLGDLIHEEQKLLSRIEYEDYFKEPGSLRNRLVRYAKSNIGTGDAYGKLQRLLSEFKFSNIVEADKHIVWEKAKKINL